MNIQTNGQMLPTALTSLLTQTVIIKYYIYKTIQAYLIMSKMVRYVYAVNAKMHITTAQQS